MIRTQQRRRAARLVLTAGLATAIAVAGLGGTAVAGTPLATPAGDILGTDVAGTIGDTYIVVLKPGSTAAAQVTSASIALAKRYGGSVRRNYLSAVRGFTVTMPAAAAHRLAADPAVQYVEQDRMVRPAGTRIDPTWGLDRLDQRALPLSGTYTSGSAAGVTAYVLDTGVRTGHTEFGGRAADGWDFVDGDPDADDCNGHGTHVAGTIGGSTYGVAKDVRLVGVRVLDCHGVGSYSGIIAGIDWVTAHAVAPAVANVSLGGEPSAALDDAVARSIAKGVTYAVAAGNANTSACDVSPARAPAAITVGATDAADARAGFSNHGLCTDLFAPGVGIISGTNSSDTALAQMSGTSMAAPHVAGAAALVLGRWPGYTPAGVRNALVAHATEGMVTDPGAGSPNRLLSTAWLDETAEPPATEPLVTVPPATVPPATVPPATTPPATKPTTVPPAGRTSCGPFAGGRSVALPDLATVSARRVVSSCSPAAASLSVQVRITHRDRGSLTITLIAPNGRSYPLKPASVRDRAANVAATYTVNAGGTARNGTWTLRISDRYRGGGVGRLDSWTLLL